MYEDDKSWSQSGFSVCADQFVPADDRQQLERLARYITRAPVRLDSVHELDDHQVLVHTPPDPKTGQTERTLDVLDWIHAVTLHIPDPGQNTTLHFGAYACRRRIAPRPPKMADPPTDGHGKDDDEPTPKGSWARLIRRLFEFDPLLCRCGARLELIACITDTQTIDRILRHIRSANYRPRSPYSDAPPRAPPPPTA